MRDKFNEKPYFPYTYGDNVINDEQRLSDLVIKFSQDKKVQRVAGLAVLTMVTLGSHVESANAIPPEAGEFAASATRGMDPSVPPLGDVVGAGAGAVANGNLGAQNPMQGAANIPGNGPNMHQMPPKPMKPGVHYRFPGPPQTVAGQTVNTAISISALAYICLQGYWGNPVFAWGCGGMVLRFLLKISKVENL